MADGSFDDNDVTRSRVGGQTQLAYRIFDRGNEKLLAHDPWEEVE